MASEIKDWKQSATFEYQKEEIVRKNLLQWQYSVIKGFKMQALNYTSARNNLKSIIEDVCENNEEVIVTTKNNKSVVIISLDEYNATHAKIKQDVQNAIKEIQKGDFLDIDDAFEAAKNSYRA